jgi:hypothetical protein
MSITYALNGPAVFQDDRLTPSVAGGIVGLFAGPIALGMASAVAGKVVTAPILRAADVRGVDVGVSFAIAFMTAAAIGSLAGGAFAFVTRYLRRWLPLSLWGMVFFVCLAMVVVTAPHAAGRYLLAGSVPPELSLPVLTAGAVFGLLVSFSLPIRRRR